MNSEVFRFLNRAIRRHKSLLCIHLGGNQGTEDPEITDYYMESLHAKDVYKKPESSDMYPQEYKN